MVMLTGVGAQFNGAPTPVSVLMPPYNRLKAGLSIRYKCSHFTSILMVYC
jgi:hypothetical protein